MSWHKQRAGFRRDLLPSPAEVLGRAGVVVRSISRSQLIALCPFHDDRNPSFAMHTETGAFRCMACGASGSDHLHFFQRITGMGFREAARDLGAWGEV